MPACKIQRNVESLSWPFELCGYVLNESVCVLYVWGIGVGVGACVRVYVRTNMRKGHVTACVCACVRCRGGKIEIEIAVNEYLKELYKIPWTTVRVNKNIHTHKTRPHTR